MGYGLGALIGGGLAGLFGFQAMYLCGAAIVGCGWALSRLGRLMLGSHMGRSSEKTSKGVAYVTVAIAEPGL